MPPIVTSAEIERPAAEVFAYATDPARFSEWQQGVVDGHMDGPPDGTQTPAVGAKCVTTRRIGGASRPSTSELTHIDPPRTWGVRGTDGPIRAAVEVLVEPLSGSRSARKEMPGNVAALKQKMEADSAANHRDLAGDGQDDV
ncbi:MAG TPA: SRPBCC family protein [Trebonia sp.]|nr:SRPBCC family protein [Trebonia sp.]